MAGTQSDVVKSFSINGINARDWGVELIGIEGRGLVGEVIAREFRFPGQGGAPRQYGDLPGVPIHRLTGYVVGDNAADCRMKYSQFLLNVGLPVDIEQQLLIRSVEGQEHVLIYYDEPHKKWKTLYNGGHTRRALKPEQWKLGRFLFFTLEFKIPDVYAYGDEILRTLSLASGSHFLSVPTGTAPSRPRLIFTNNSTADISTLDVVGGKFAFNSTFDDMDVGGFPKARGIKNDQWFTGDFGTIYYQTGKLSQGIALSGSEIQADTCWYYNRADQATPTDFINARVNANQGTTVIWAKSSKNWNDGKKWYFWDNGSGLHIIKDTDNYLKIYDAADGNNSVLDVSSYVAGTWYLIVGWWDRNGSSTKLQIFAGATSLSSGSAVTAYTPTTPGQKGYIGSDLNGMYSCNCVVDDFRVYNRALTSSERSDLINGGSGTTDLIAPENLICYFDFDGTVGSSVGSTVDGSQFHRGLDVSAISQGANEATLTVAGGGTIFVDNDYVLISDEIGFGKYGYVDGNPTSTQVQVDDGAGGAVSGIDTVGVYPTFSGSNYFVKTSPSGIDMAADDGAGAGNYSASAWIKTTYSGIDMKSILYKDGASGNGWLLNLQPDGTIRAYIFNTTGSAFITQTSTKTVNDGEWHQVGFTYNDAASKTLTIYIDGYSDGSTATTSGTKDTGAGDVGVGYFFNSTNYFEGSIKDVAIWTSDQSSNMLTIATNPQVETGSPASWWKLTDADFSSTANDDATAANNNDLTNTGSVTRIQSAFISKNLIADAGMENGGIGANSLIVRGDANKSSSAKFDKQSIQFTVAAGETSGYIVLDNIGVSSNANYVFGGWKKGSDAVGNTYFWIGGDGGATGVYLEQNPASSWTYSEMSLKTTGTQTYVQVQLARDGGTGKIAYFDQLSLLPNLVDNGGMEGGANPPTGWTQETNATATSDTSPHSGTNCLKIVAAADNVGAYQNVTLINSNHYKVSGWAKATSGDSAVIIVDKGDGTTLTVGTVTATSWTRISAKFQATGTAGKVYCRGVSNGDIVWFDDVAILKDDAVTGTITALGAGYKFAPTRRGKGFYTAADLLVFGAVGNPDKWSCVWRGRPQFAYNIGEDVTLFEHYFDVNNYFRIFYDASEDKFTFRKYAQAAYDATTKAMNFSSDEEITLICSFDDVNGSQIYFNGSSDGSTPNADTNGLVVGTTTERGTAQAGSSTSITLASTASETDDYYVGWVIEITGGTGSGQQRKITAYNGTTKVATTNSWTTTPDSTSTYILYSSSVTIGGTTSGTQLANIITDELVILTDKLTAHEAAIIHERNEPLHNHNGAIKLSATIAPDDFVDINCDDLDIQQFDASGKADVSLLANGITSNNSRFFQLHPAEKLNDGDIIWCENSEGKLEVRYDIRYV